MNLFKLAYKNLFKKKTSTILTILGISLGIAAFLALVTLIDSLQIEFEKKYAQRGTDLFIYEKDKSTLLTSIVDEQLADEIKTVAGVIDATPVALDFIRLHRKYHVVFGWKPDSYIFKTANIIQGRTLDGAPDQAVLGDLAAKRFKKNVGDTIKISRRDFEVVGISASGNIFDRGAIILPLKSLQEIKSHDNKVTLLEVKVAEKMESANSRGKVAAKVQKTLRKKYPFLSIETTKEFLSGDDRLLSLIRAVTKGISIIALAIVILGTMNVIMLSVFDKTKEIGILRAIGWNKQRIFLLIICESMCLSILGGIVGISIGFLGLNYLIGFLKMQSLFGAFWSGTFLLQVCLSVLGVGIVSALYPAFRAISLSPVEALRHE